MCRGYLGDVSGMIRGCLGDVSGMFRGYVPDIFCLIFDLQIYISPHSYPHMQGVTYVHTRLQQTEEQLRRAFAEERTTLQEQTEEQLRRAFAEERTTLQASCPAASAVSGVCVRRRM